MTDLTLIVPHYANLGMLAEQQRIWADYPAELRAKLHVIVADDCSPKGQRPSAKSISVSGLGSLRIYRCLKKVRWNWLFGRNLGVAMATTDWVLLTDIDHAMPAETFAKLAALDLDPASVYRLARVDAVRPWPFALADCAIREHKMFHPNTWLMTRAMYDAVGGYDERLSGCYGTDGEFRDRVTTAAKAVVHLSDVRLVRYSREVIPDASTTCYTRKNDPTNDDELRARRAQRETIPNWRPLRVTFPYEQVA